MRVLLAIVCFLSLCGYSLGQQNELILQDQPLKEAVPKLENHFNVKFSFVDEVIENKVISAAQSTENNKEDFFASLERSTGLKFDLVQEDYIVIRTFKPDDEVNVCGFIKNSSGQPIRGVTGVSDRDGMGLVSNESGFFEIKGVGHGSEVDLSHVGFMGKKVKVAELFQMECPVITLTLSTEILSEIVIKDFLAVGITKRNQSLEILPQELKVLPGLVEPDILLSIQQSPGVNSPFETASGIYVRGGSPDLNLIKWNGIKTYGQGHFFGMLSSFNPYITKEVLFIKNGTSARYGDRVSGVIDIKSGEDIPDQFSGGAGFNMIYGDAYVDIPLVKDKLSAQVSGRRSYTDYVETVTYDQFSERVFQNTKINEDLSSDTQLTNNNFFFNDFSSKIIFKPGVRNKFLVNTIYNKNDLDFVSEDQGQQFSDVLKTENEGYDLAWKHDNENFQLEMDAYFTQYKLRYEFKSIENDLTKIASKKNFIRDYGVNVNLTFPVSDNSKVHSGLQFSKNSVRYAFQSITPLYNLVLDEDDSEMNTHAFYVEYQLSKPNTQLSMGMRYNFYKELNEQFYEPRVMFQQRLAEGLRLNASAEYRTQVVSQIKESVVSDLSLENQVWTLSSPNRFPVIDSYQFTTGVSYEKNSWLFDADVYRKKVRGITTLTFGFLNPVDSDYRIGDSNIRGADFFIKKQMDSYKTWLGYSYLLSENKFMGLNNDEPFPGNWNIEHTIKWSHFYTVKDIQFALGWFWHTGKSFTNVVEAPTDSGPVSVQFGDINGDNLPVYHRVDFSALYEFQFRQSKRVKYRVGLSILNIYNRKNLLNREFRTTPSLENELIDTRIYSLGITPNLVFRVFW